MYCFWKPHLFECKAEEDSRCMLPLFPVAFVLVQAWISLYPTHNHSKIPFFRKLLRRGWARCATLFAPPNARDPRALPPRTQASLFQHSLPITLIGRNAAYFRPEYGKKAQAQTLFLQFRPASDVCARFCVKLRCVRVLVKCMLQC